MKKKALLASAALAVLGATTSYGAVVANVVDLGIPNDGAGANGYGDLAGYHAFRIDLDAGAGQKVTAVDFSAEGAAGKVITAPMHQYWQLSKSKTGVISVSSRSAAASASGTSFTAANNDGTMSYDSHFTFDPGQVTVGSNPDENNDAGDTNVGTSPFANFNVNPGAGTPSDGWGRGTTLSGAWGIQGPVQTQVTPVAYLVIPDSARASDLLVATAQVSSTEGISSVGVVIPAIPEPAALGLVLSSGLFLRRRRA